jgi:hypothetical protein
LLAINDRTLPLGTWNSQARNHCLTVRQAAFR